jgi:hypothetical protein
MSKTLLFAIIILLSLCCFAAAKSRSLYLTGNMDYCRNMAMYINMYDKDRCSSQRDYCYMTGVVAKTCETVITSCVNEANRNMGGYYDACMNIKH